MMTNNKWMAKAGGYLIVIDILLSLLFYAMLTNGGNSGWFDMNIVQIMLYVAIPATPLSVGIALREENQSPTKQSYSKILIAIGTVIIVPICLLVLLLTFISA